MDFPKAGFKDSNDGNTSKRFLADPQTSSYITGADINSIKKKLILTNLQKQLQKFAFNHMDDTQWRQDCIRFLRHDAKIINHTILPFGRLSKEATEVRKKTFVFSDKILQEYFRGKAATETIKKNSAQFYALLSSIRKKV